eukprot:Selendium_serpulae@DN6585_c0_g1_i1.p1
MKGESISDKFYDGTPLPRRCWRNWKALATRNLLSKTRSPIATLLEFLIPVGVVLVLYIPYALVTDSSIGAADYTTAEFDGCTFGEYGSFLDGPFTVLMDTPVHMRPATVGRSVSLG